MHNHLKPEIESLTIRFFQDNEPIYFVRTSEDQGLIPTTVTELFFAQSDKNCDTKNQTIGDLYKILLKVVAENKNLKQCLEEYELILYESEVYFVIFLNKASGCI